MKRPSFPTDEMTLRLLIEACRINDDTGRSHLMDFLDMGTRVASKKDETAKVFGEEEAADESTPRVYLVEYEEGHAPFSPQTVIEDLALEILRLRGEES